MDDECIALLLEHDTWYVPTLAISHLTARQATNSFEAAWGAHLAIKRQRGAIFSGPNAHERALRYADRQYGNFEEIGLAPYP
jgi:hypothetical protein